jgi:hypothetical protein
VASALVVGRRELSNTRSKLAIQRRNKKTNKFQEIESLNSADQTILNARLHDIGGKELLLKAGGFAAIWKFPCG